MTTFREHQHPRQADGRFAVKAHDEADVALTAVPRLEPEMMPALLRNIERTVARHDADHIGNQIRQRLRSHQMTPQEARAELDALSHGGRCHRHAGLAHDALDVLLCRECQTAKLVQGVIDPGPEPVPIGDPPSRVVAPHSASQAARHGGQLDDASPFTWQVREHLGIAEGTPIALRSVDAFWECEDFDEHAAKDCTCEEYSYLEVRAGEHSWDFESFSDLEAKATHRVRPEVTEMALRLMRAVSAEGPLLRGYAAIYTHQPYRDPEPVYAKVINCFLKQSHPQLHVEYQNGVEAFLDVARIAAIRETDQTSVYDEG